METDIEAEHPDDVRARRQAWLSLAYGFAAVALAVGFGLVLISLSVQSWWAGERTPPDVVEAIGGSLRAGAVFLGLGLCVMVVTWTWSRHIGSTRAR